MDNKLQIFENAEFGSLRTVEINGETYFVGKDVAEILGYANTFDAIDKHIDDEDKLVSQIASAGQMRKVTVINESGLYSLILSSKLPKAKEFKHWVTSEVLPAIRKHGAYFTPKTFDEILKSPLHLMTLLKNWQEDREEKERLQEVIEIQNLQISEMTPKASYYDLILQSKEALPISIIAKDYGMSGKAMNQLLHTLKIQYPMSGTWLVYQNYAKKGYTCTKTVSIREDYSKTYTNWTQKGRLFLYETLKQNGYLPLIEQAD